ncbi:undecaprenyl-diphosphatase UppP [candidate division WWE3 bacterium]|nr:undecaprenyl-diphosphatase UppP [candidate division WWE3 bacterium]
MNLFQAFILGAIQALSEFLPISSSGHLIVVPSLFGWQPHSLVFDTTLHLGTAAALLAFFFKDLYNIGLSFISDVWNSQDNFSNYSQNGKYAIFILLGSLPAGIIGFVFENQIEVVFRDVKYVALFLILGSALMFIAEKSADHKKSLSMNYFKSLVIGFFQSLALLPGFSRSGSTISGGMLFGLSRENAARFSFLLSIPIVVLVGTYQLLKSYHLITTSFMPSLLIGFFTSFIVGLLVIKFLLKFLNKHGLSVFIIYRLVLALVLLLFVKM